MSRAPVKLVPLAERKLAKGVETLGETYHAWAEQASAMNSKLDGINSSLLIIAGAITNIGSFVKRWGMIAVSILAIIYPTVGKIISQAAERAGVIDVEPVNGP